MLFHTGQDLHRGDYGKDRLARSQQQHVHPSDMYTQNERVVHNVLQEALLARYVERRCIAWRRDHRVHPLRNPKNAVGGEAA